MNDLPPVAVEHLYPVLLLVLAFAMVLAGLVGGLWAGFRWLKNQIHETAEAMLAPVIERVAVLEKAVDAAHRRIDAFLGKRP